MHRREFLLNTAGTLSVAVAGSAFDVAGSGPHAIPYTSARVPKFELDEITVEELQQRMKSGELSSRSITKKYLNRIAALDKKGPAVNAVIEINPDALTIAAAMDEERKAGKIRGPLHGIPILIKDNIDSGDRMMTTAGALALEGNIALKDAFIVAKLREAGAVLLGKTNLSEWANFRSTRSSSGWSSRGGQTKNPHVLNRNPSGSSSGTAAAVSANFCAVSIGTETNGSIISPSSYCGVVGLKPTVGLWSRSGIIPISATQDTAGPMTRTVKDAAILLGALAGEDTADPVTAGSKGKVHNDYSVFCKKDALKGRRIGIEKSYLQGHEGVVAFYKEAIDVLKSQGVEIVEIELLKLTRPTGSNSVLYYEFKDGVNKYLARANAKVKTVAEVIAFNKANEVRAMPFFKQEILEMSEAKGSLTEKEYIDDLAKVIGTRMIIDDMMRDNKLNAICSPSSGPASCIDLVNGSYSSGFSFSSPAAWSGYPHITVPMGYISDLPIGFSFIAGAWQEGEIIGMAYAYEQASNKRRAPQFKLPVY